MPGRFRRSCSSTLSFPPAWAPAAKIARPPRHSSIRWPHPRRRRCSNPKGLSLHDERRGHDIRAQRRNFWRDQARYTIKSTLTDSPRNSHSMLLVKTYLDKSAIHGLGVFAAERIRKETKIWRFVYGFDQVYT